MAKVREDAVSGALMFEQEDWVAFRTVEGLQRKAGVASASLRRLVLKELADNALDTGAKVTVGKTSGRVGFFVDDLGPGIDPDDVGKMFSIKRPLTTSKMLRLPTRGALGNGLRVAAGAVLASNGWLTVITHNVRLELRPDGDTGLTNVVSRTQCDRPVGTRVEIGFGPDLPKDENTLFWADAAIKLEKGTFCARTTALSGRWSPASTAALAQRLAKSSSPLA
jgi:hypothetical protein